MLYDAQRRDISIAVGGDAMITRKMNPHKEDRFLQLVNLIRATDCAIVNLEMLFHDYEYSWEYSGGTPTRSDPRNLQQLKWMGIDAVTTANNHAYDFSEGGFLTTLEHCREFDLPQAGGGKNLDELYFTTAATKLVQGSTLDPVGYDWAAYESSYRGGGLFRIKLGIQGREEFKADFAWPGEHGE